MDHFYSNNRKFNHSKLELSLFWMIRVWNTLIIISLKFCHKIRHVLLLLNQHENAHCWAHGSQNLRHYTLLPVFLIQIEPWCHLTIWLLVWSHVGIPVGVSKVLRWTIIIYNNNSNYYVRKGVIPAGSLSTWGGWISLTSHFQHKSRKRCCSITFAGSWTWTLNLPLPGSTIYL